MKKLIQDFFAFVFDKDARIISDKKYPSGRFMSVREAKKLKNK